MPDPATYYFTQGVLGVTVLVLGLVVRALWIELKKKEAEKIAILEAWRLETKTEGKDALDVVKGNSQSLFYLADKIEAAKAKGKTL
jgi:hypothetical protein